MFEIRDDTCIQGIVWGKLKGRDYLNNLGIDVRIILKQIWRKQDGKVWNGFIWFKIGGSGKLL